MNAQQLTEALAQLVANAEVTRIANEETKKAGKESLDAMLEIAKSLQTGQSL